MKIDMTSTPQTATIRPGTTLSANEATAIPPGYKQTEVGVIPEDWGVDCLSRFWDVTDCKHVTAKFVASGYPVASIKEAQSRFVDLTNAKQTTQQFYNLLTEGGRKPVIGDLILSRNATVGEVAQVADWHPPFAMGQDVCLLRRKSPEFSPDFLQAIFRSSIIGNQLSDLMVGSTFKRANVQQIKSFVVPMPGPAEQEAIAEALSDIDELLGSLEKLIAKKRAIKQAAMQQLLTGQIRLPGFSGAWETRRLGEIATFLKGSGLSKADLSLDGKRRCVHYGELFTVYSERITEVLHGTDREGIFFYSIRNDVLMPTSDVTPNGLATASCILASDIIIGGDVLVIRVPESVLNGEFLAYAIKIHRDQVMQLVSGTTVFHLYGRDMANFSFAVPSVAEQTAIAVVLSDMDAEITTLERRRDKTRTVKQGMMQQLLTGRVRLLKSAHAEEVTTC